MQIKKTILLLLLAFTFVSCANKTTSPETTGESSQIVTTTTETDTESDKEETDDEVYCDVDKKFLSHVAQKECTEFAKIKFSADGTSLNVTSSSWSGLAIGSYTFVDTVSADMAQYKNNSTSDIVSLELNHYHGYAHLKLYTDSLNGSPLGDLSSY